MAPHSSTPAWKIPWTEEPGGLQSMGLLWVGYDWATELNWILFLGFPGGSEVKASACNAGDQGLIPGLGGSPGEGNGNLLQYSCLENPMDGGAWWATVHGVAKSWTWLSDFTFTFILCLDSFKVIYLFLIFTTFDLINTNNTFFVFISFEDWCIKYIWKALKLVSSFMFCPIFSFFSNSGFQV